MNNPGRPPVDRSGPAPATAGLEGALTHRVGTPARPTLTPSLGRVRRMLGRATSVRRSLRVGVTVLGVGGIALDAGCLVRSAAPTDAHDPDVLRAGCVGRLAALGSSSSVAAVVRRLDTFARAPLLAAIRAARQVYIAGPLLRTEPC